MQNATCPCGSHKLFEHCCGRFLTASEIPKTPEELMRSRYSAFVTQNAAYLVKTLHQSKHTENLKTEIQLSFKNTHWYSLRILRTAIKGNSGHVEFVAFFTSHDGNLNQLHEASEFWLENEQWVYNEGKVLDPIKLGRNDPCWCGSLKKLKKCHPE